MSNDNWMKKFNKYEPKSNKITSHSTATRNKQFVAVCNGFAKCNHDKCLFTERTVSECIFYSGSKDNVSSCVNKCGRNKVII